MSGGNPFGKDVNKYGSDDWHARKVYDEWKAERHPAPKPSNAPIIPSPMFPNISSGAQRSSSVSAGGSTTGGFTKFLAFVIVVVGFIAYFGSKSDSSRGSVPESN